MPKSTIRVDAGGTQCAGDGTWILGTGGGGDPSFSLLEAREQLAAAGGPKVIDPLSLAG